MKISYLFEKINKIDKSLGKLIKKKEGKCTIININIENGDITIHYKQKKTKKVKNNFVTINLIP